MADVFQIPIANSFRWRIQTPVVDPRYNSLPFEEQVDNNCYWAKWQTIDKAQVQLLSDFVPTLDIRDYYSNDIVLNVPILVTPFNILDVTFKCYEAEILWAIVGEGDYYLTLTYNDGTNDIVYETSPIQVRDEQPQTMLFECKNSENDKGVIFETGIVINFRVEGLKDRKFLPKSDSQLYTDQKYNQTQENSIPYRNFTIDIGTADGLPNWVIDKVNVLFSLDQKKVDGTYYEKEDDGTNFEPTRADIGYNEDGWWSLSVVPQDNLFLQAYTTGENPINGDYKVVRDSKSYLNIAADVTASGIFKTNYVLDYAKITNKLLAPFTIKFGTTNGGNEIAEQDISSDLTSIVTLRYGFETAQDVYITGLTGQSVDIWLAFDKLDAVSVVPAPAGSGGFVKNTVYMYEELTDGDFDIHWDVSTGLGRAGTGYEGCALSDGRNGTIDRAFLLPMPWDRTLPATRDTSIGNVDNQLVQTVAQMPSHTHSYNLRIRGNVYPNQTDNADGTIDSPRTTGSAGLGQAMDITPHSLVTVFFVKITD